MVDKVELQEFLDRARGVAGAAHQASLAIARAVAPRFCPIALLAQNEGDVSRLLAFLLSPAANHGQGMCFIRIFLRLAGLPDSNDDGDSVGVWTEDVLSTGDGRADIRVDYTCRDGRGMHLLIENKPWAGDGPNQIERYANYMRRMHDPSWAVIYMPPTERDPGMHAIKPERLRSLVEGDHFVSFPYSTPHDEKSVRGWLQRCEFSCEAEAPRRFIRDFINYLDVNVAKSGVLQMTDAARSVSQIIVTFLQEREKDIDTALEIEKALQGLRLALADEVWRAIADAIRDRLQGDWQVDAQFSTEQYSAVAVRRPKWPTGKDPLTGEDLSCSARLEFAKENLKEGMFGVRAYRKVVTDEVRDRIARSVRAEFPELRSATDGWPAYRQKSLDQIPSDWLSDGFLNFARRARRGESDARTALERFVAKLARIAVIADEVFTTSTTEPGPSA
jgi:hypothetical protein